jgi:nucleoside-triphosphatase
MKILLEGRPGSGKTTVARRLAELLRADGIPLAGFTTEEIREGGRRVGFAVETVDGVRATLAHVSLPGPPRVGKYGVDLHTFEQLGLAALEAVPDRGVVVIDEIGKMELESEAFRERVLELVALPVRLVGTVQLARNPFTDRLKGSRDVQVIRVSERNREELPADLAQRLGS